MKILVFTSLYPNNMRPTHGVFVKERMTAVSRLPGWQVTVVAPVPYFPPLRLGRRWLYSQVARKEMIEGVEVHHPRYLMIPKVAMALHGPLMFLSLWRFVRNLHRERCFDLIDAHYVYPDGFAGVCLGRALGLPVVVSARGTDVNLFARFPLIRAYLSHTLRRAHMSIAVCQALKKAMVELGVPADKVVVVPNGVDERKFFPLPKEEARAKLGLPAGAIILSVGHLIPRKGFDSVIRALSLLRERNRRDAQLIIVGEGQERHRLIELARSLGLADNVRLVGGIPHEHLGTWYSAADVFCLASSREGWPNVVLESMACGTPVVATAVWGTPEVVTSREVGLLVEANESAIAGTLAYALEKPWNRKAIVEYAREHSWDRVAASVERVMVSVLQERNRAPEPS